MGAISEKEIEIRIDDITMQIEELSAMSGGMLYKDILNEISLRLLIKFEPEIINELEELRDRYTKEDFAIRCVIDKIIDIIQSK